MKNSLYASVKVKASNIEALFKDAKASVTSNSPIPVPKHWVLMNAPRPLVGDKLAQGDFITGRFYAAINLLGDDAETYVRTNLKLDACIVIVATDDEIDAAARKFIPPGHLGKFDAFEEAKKKQLLKTYRSKMHGMKYNDLVNLLKAT